MSIYIISGKTGQRAAHWRDIQTRVTTHEGEVLSGEKGKQYQKKYSGEMLGKDLSQAKQADVAMVEQHQHQESQKEK